MGFLHSSVGIKADLRKQEAPAESIITTGGRANITVGYSRDRVLLQWAQNRSFTTLDPVYPSYVYHPPSRSWGKWAIGDHVTLEVQRQPTFFFECANRSFAVGNTTLWDLTNVWNPSPSPVVGPYAGADGHLARLQQDQYATTADAFANAEIGGRIQWGDRAVNPGRTVRVRTVTVNHGCQYTGGTPKTAGQIQVGVDPDPTVLSTAATLNARVTATSPAYDVGKYFTDRIQVEDVNEGALLRFVWTKPATTAYTNLGGNVLFRVSAKIQVTRIDRVDSTGP